MPNAPLAEQADTPGAATEDLKTGALLQSSLELRHSREWRRRAMLLGALLAALLPYSAPNSALAEDTAQPGSTPSSTVRAAPVPQASELPAPVASYDWAVQLDAERHRLSGRGTIQLHNVSRAPLHELWFHLYLNAFENEQTLFLRTGGGRSGKHAGRPGSLRVTRLARADDPTRDLSALLAPHSPNDPNDRTDLRLPLDRALEPDATLLLRVEFEAELPEFVERTGFSDDFHLIAQWFPKLAKLEPDGRFAHFAFHPFAEFYADFGDYRVEMDVPADHVVGSTGRLQLLRRTTDRAIYEARAQGVHDFAWVSARALEVEERRLDHVDVRVLSSSAGGARARSALWSTIEHALPFYEGLYGRYPHPTLTVVHPPGDAGPAGGMEYPMFFTVGQPDWVQTLGTRWLETVAAHELGHQWFQGILASNEARYPFLDEGLASHAEWRFLESTFGDSSQLDTPFLRISRAATGRYAGLASRRVRVIDQPATAFPSFGALSSHVYGRTALFLESLRRIHGDAAYDRAMRDYTTRQRFRHPTPPRLFESLGLLGPATREAAWAWFERSARASLRVGELISGPGGLTRVEVRRGGPIRLPLEVQARFADGSTQLRRLDSPNEREWIEFHCASPLLEVVVDPHRRWLIDDELFDNRARPRASGGAASFGALSGGMTSGGMTGSFDTGPRLRWLAELALRVLSP